MVAVRCWRFRPCGHVFFVRTELCVDGVLHVLHRMWMLSMGTWGPGTSLEGPLNPVELHAAPGICHFSEERLHNFQQLLGGF